MVVTSPELRNPEAATIEIQDMNNTQMLEGKRTAMTNPNPLENNSLFQEELHPLTIAGSKDQQTYTVEFQENTFDPWGCAISFNLGWQHWKMSKIVKGKQAERLGIGIGDRIVGLNDIALNEANCDSMEEKLRKGVPCTITWIKSQDVETKLITFQPGKIGIVYQKNKITAVRSGSQAQNAGVCVGWTILAVNNQPQSDNEYAIHHAINETSGNGNPTLILFQDTSKTHNITSSETIPNTTESWLSNSSYDPVVEDASVNVYAAEYGNGQIEENIDQRQIKPFAWFCVICNKSIHISDKESHLCGEEHQKKLQYSNE